MNEVCPSCGRFVATLEDQTGWCAECAGHKQCARCGTHRPRTEYRPHIRAKDGLRGTCRPCENLAERAAYEADLEAKRAHNRERQHAYRARRRSKVAA